MRRKFVPSTFGDGSLARATSENAVVIEYHDAIGGDPRIGLESGRAQTLSESERVDGVLGGVRPSPAVSESDGGVEK